MDRLWGVLAGILTAASIITLLLGAWGWSLVTGIIGGVISGLLAYDEFDLQLGPVGMMRCYRVWSIDVGPCGVHGIGLNWRRVRFRRVKG